MGARDSARAARRGAADAAGPAGPAGPSVEQAARPCLDATLRPSFKPNSQRAARLRLVAGQPWARFVSHCVAADSWLQRVALAAAAGGRPVAAKERGAEKRGKRRRRRKRKRRKLVAAEDCRPLSQSRSTANSPDRGLSDCLIVCLLACLCPLKRGAFKDERAGQTSDKFSSPGQARPGRAGPNFPVEPTCYITRAHRHHKPLLAGYVSD